MNCGTTMDFLPRVQAGSRSGGRHHRAKARRRTARAAVFQAAMAEAAVPSGLVAMTSIVKPRLQQPGQEPRTASPLVPMLSMDFVSQEHGLPHDGPKDSNAGG
jgi:hypothetical protein